MDPAGEYGAVVELVRTLKGAPSSVLWALFLSQRPHTKSELEAATGYSDKPIKRAMDYLESRGLVQRHGSRWSLSERIARNFSEHNRRFSDRNRNISGQNRNLSASEERIVAVVDLDEDKDHIQQQQICRDVRGFSDNGSGESELEALLRRIGVIGRAFDRLSKRPDLQAQPLVVLAWWWYYRAQKWAEKPAGAVIRRQPVIWSWPEPGRRCRLRTGRRSRSGTGAVGRRRSWPTISYRLIQG